VSEQAKAALEAQLHAESLDRLVTELQLRTTQMTVLNEMSDLLQCCANLKEAFAVVSQSARKLFSISTGGAVFVFRSSRNALEAKATWGQTCVSEPLFSPGECWALRRGLAHWSEKPGDAVVCQHLRNPVPASYLCVPMVALGEMLGVLHVQYDRSESTKGTDAFETLQESQKRLAIAASGQIGLSLASLQLRESLRDQSIRDPLTGLFNRRFMEEFLERELQRARRKKCSLAVVYMDVDHFKKVNDKFGHDAGDAVLRSLAKLLLSLFRGEDVVCRYGGEEFAVILPESTAREAAKRSEELRAAAKSLRVPYQGQLLDEISVSLGVSAFPEHAENREELLRVADACLYRSKSDGRDRVTVADVKDSA
jgi:diguanylate cyclase (GGDEF)-like protein